MSYAVRAHAAGELKLPVAGAPPSAAPDSARRAIHWVPSRARMASHSGCPNGCSAACSLHRRLLLNPMSMEAP